MQSYFAVATLDRIEEIRRDAGYARARALFDQLAEHIAQALPAASSIRANRATVEFTLRCSSPHVVVATLTKLRENIAGEVSLLGQTVPRTLTIAAVPSSSVRLSDIAVACAEQALAEARQRRVPVFVASRPAEEPDDDLLIADLQRAIRRDELCLHYQPKFRARQGEPVGSEALLRWEHPTLGAISPARFVPLAERSGEVRRLTEWVLERAIADQAALADAGVSLPSHINMPAPLIGEVDFIDHALARLGGLTSIGMEITETAMIGDPEGTLVSLQRLAEAGVHLAVDDYGTGFSSLAYLQRLPVKEIKIDRSFVSRLSTGGRDPLLVRSTIDLGHALEMEVTAEGVDSPAVFALLQVMGCDMAQGFLLSHPLPLADLIEFARTAPRNVPRPLSLRERAAERRANREGNA